jgi:hypothetical protein
MSYTLNFLYAYERREANRRRQPKAAAPARHSRNEEGSGTADWIVT